MQLEVLTPGKNIFSGEIKVIKVPGSKGSFEILHNHAAIVSTLSKGDVKIETDKGEIIHYKIKGGVVEMKNNHIVLLIESME